MGLNSACPGKWGIAWEAQVDAPKTGCFFLTQLIAARGGPTGSPVPTPIDSLGGATEKPDVGTRGDLVPVDPTCPGVPTGLHVAALNDRFEGTGIEIPKPTPTDRKTPLIDAPGIGLLSYSKQGLPGHPPKYRSASYDASFVDYLMYLPPAGHDGKSIPVAVATMRWKIAGLMGSTGGHWQVLPLPPSITPPPAAINGTNYSGEPTWNNLTPNTPTSSRPSEDEYGTAPAMGEPPGNNRAPWPL